MSDPRAWLADGGWTMLALTALALVLGLLMLERWLAVSAGLRDVRRRGDAAAEQLSADPAGLRRMGLIRAGIVIAPLLGLLGTVTGMIETFESILRGGYVNEMSEGIRKALLTTQYGLAIAAPGLLAERVLLGRVERLERLVRAAALPAGEAAP